MPGDFVGFAPGAGLSLLGVVVAGLSAGFVGGVAAGFGDPEGTGAT